MILKRRRGFETLQVSGGLLPIYACLFDVLAVFLVLVSINTTYQMSVSGN